MYRGSFGKSSFPFLQHEYGRHDIDRSSFGIGRYGVMHEGYSWGAFPCLHSGPPFYSCFAFLLGPSDLELTSQPFFSVAQLLP